MSHSDEELLAGYLGADLPLDPAEAAELAELIRTLHASLPPVEPSMAFRASLRRRVLRAATASRQQRPQPFGWPAIQLPWAVQPRSVTLEERVIPFSTHRSLQRAARPMPVVVSPAVTQYRVELLIGAALLAGIAWWMRNHPESIPTLKLPGAPAQRRSAA